MDHISILSKRKMFVFTQSCTVSELKWEENEAGYSPTFSFETRTESFVKSTFP